MTTMPTRRLGGLQVSAIGLGEMPMSLAGRPDEARSVRTIHAALDAGVTLIDTADAYCIDESEVGHGERLVAKALAAWPGDRDRVLVATKGGHTREGGEWGLDGRPEHLRQACEASLRALGVETIGLYQFHRPDPKVPFAESVGALAELEEAGKVRLVGLSNVSVDQIRQARQLVQVASVQNKFSPRFRRSEGELAFCAAARITFLPENPRRDRPRPRPGRPPPRLCGHRRGPRRLSPAGRPGLAAGQGPGGHPHPRVQPPRDDHRQRRRDPAAPERRRAGPPRPGLDGSRRLGVLARPVPAGVREQEHQQEAGQEHGHLEPQGALERLGEVGPSGGVGGGGHHPADLLLPLPWASARAQLAGTANGSLALARSSKQVRKPAATCWVAAGGSPAPWRSRWRPPMTSSATPAAWLPSRPKKTTPITATPMAPPTCWTVESTPEAAPASWPLMPARTTLTSGATTLPSPRPQTSRAGASCQEPTAPP